MPSINPSYTNTSLEEPYKVLRKRVGNYEWEKNADIPAMLIAVRWALHPEDLYNRSISIKQRGFNSIY